MIRLKEHKYQTENKPIEKLPLSSRVYIPLSQHIGNICEPMVKIGDSVFTGQMIAQAQAHVYAPIHASISGKVVSIQDWPHPVLGRCKAIVIDGSTSLTINPEQSRRIDGSTSLTINPEQSRRIENDGLNKTHNSQLATHNEIEDLTADEIRKIVLEAGIVGMGGAGFPAHIKLNPPKPVDTLIINGAECEPYLTGDYRLMLEKTKEILQGFKLVERCLGVKKVYIAIEDNKPEAIKVFNYELRITNYELRVLKSMYPQGGEKQLIKKILNKEVPAGKLPFDIGVVVHNVATIFAIYEAVYINKPLYERVVTVAGSCLTEPKNLLVRIGTPIKDLLDFCGSLKEEPAKIIMGGPMMGIAQFSEDVPIIKSSTGVLLFNKKEAAFYEELPCIRCGACVSECPVWLLPTLINLASRRQLWEEAKIYGALDCIECGVCSYVCPSNIMLVQSIKRAKLELK